MTILITGSLGLVGSTASHFFLEKGHSVIGIDNNMRQTFFGDDGATQQQLTALEKNKKYKHHSIDIRNASQLENIFNSTSIDAIIHTAAQPSHDRAKDMPLLDFEVNAQATLQLLDLTRQYQPESVFIFTSTNKVYGDTPNTLDFEEQATRYWFKDSIFKGFNEATSIDQSTHSLFGCSKASADLYVQEYGRYFGLKTTTLRLGCITGTAHASVKLHGFLSYLVKSLVTTQSYQIIGYKGKQVRDQIHAHDLAQAFELIIDTPQKGVVYNLGGGEQNAASILECIELIKKKTNLKFDISFENTPRVGDHICYVTDFSAFQSQYPSWKITKNLDTIIDELIASQHENNI